jgi:hypothetical protein
MVCAPATDTQREVSHVLEAPKEEIMTIEEQLKAIQKTRRHVDMVRNEAVYWALTVAIDLALDIDVSDDLARTECTMRR